MARAAKVRFDLSVRCQRCQTAVWDGEPSRTGTEAGEGAASAAAAAVAAVAAGPGEASAGAAQERAALSLVSALPRGLAADSFILLSTRGPSGDDASAPRRAGGGGRAGLSQSGRAQLSSALGEGSRRYRQALYKRELLALALGSAERDPLDASALLVRPQVAAEAMRDYAARQRCDMPQQPASLCLECLEYCQGLLRREVLEQCQMQDGLRELASTGGPSKQQRSGSTATSAGAGTIWGAAEADDFARLLARQKELASALAETAAARAAVLAEAARVGEDDRELAEQEARHWADVRNTHALVDAAAEARDALMRRLKTCKRALRQLGPIHAFNDAFFIWRDGDYGTINGFRLGQLLGALGEPTTTPSTPPQPPPPQQPHSHSHHHQQQQQQPAQPPKPPPMWEEVNTAWGLSAMLLSAIAQSCAFEFAGFRIVPMGSRTTVVKLGAGASKGALDFFSSRSQPVAYRLYLDAARPNSMRDRLNGLVSAGNGPVESFNAAMRAFLVCLAQLTEVALQSKSGQALKLRERMYTIDIPDETSWHKGLPPNSATINGDSVDLAHPPDAAEALWAAQAASSQQPKPEAHESAIAAAAAALLGSSRALSEEHEAHAFRWTVGLRHVLTNLKWLLVWACKEKKVQNELQKQIM
jgi:hypothetical protein